MVSIRNSTKMRSAHCQLNFSNGQSGLNTLTSRRSRLVYEMSSDFMQIMGDKKQPQGRLIIITIYLEARAGVEPTYTDLQSGA